MQDNELKKLLSETCPVLPGQENRAWAQLRERMYARPIPPRWAWLAFIDWRSGLAFGLAMICGLALAGRAVVAHYQPVSFASANSEAPGIYATSFYSHSAQAQVVWLNGLEPASDKPTYLDPTSVVPQTESSDSL